MLNTMPTAEELYQGIRLIYREHCRICDFWASSNPMFLSGRRSGKNPILCLFGLGEENSNMWNISVLWLKQFHKKVLLISPGISPGELSREEYIHFHSGLLCYLKLASVSHCYLSSNETKQNMKPRLNFLRGIIGKFKSLKKCLSKSKK